MEDGGRRGKPEKRRNAGSALKKRLRAPDRVPADGRKPRPYFLTESSSTSKISVEPGPISVPTPWSP